MGLATVGLLAPTSDRHTDLEQDALLAGARAVAAQVTASVAPATAAWVAPGRRVHGPAAGVVRWDWPVAGSQQVLRPFDPPAQRWLPGHRGVDLAGVTGAPVWAVEPGTVTFSGEIAGAGIVSVTHADGIRSTYQPVEDRVARGTRVAAGDRLGALAAGHCPLRPCLHLGAVRGRDHYLDPMLFLRPLRLVLLPEEG